MFVVNQIVSSKTLILDKTLKKDKDQDKGGNNKILIEDEQIKVIKTIQSETTHLILFLKP
jgi:hypothetical protein